MTSNGIHPQQEILDLIDRDFPKEQIINMIMNGEVYQYSQMPDGRFMRGVHLQARLKRIFRSWDVLLVKEGLEYDQFGRTTLNAHHPDEVVINDRDAISMNASEHKSFHQIQLQATMTDERRAELSEINSRSKQEYHSQLTPERKAEIYKDRGEQISRGIEKAGRSGCSLRAYNYLENHSGQFFNADINEVAKYAGLGDMNSWLREAIKANYVEIIGKGDHRAFIYRSLIYKGDRHEYDIK